ncbi:MAG TPA: ABC transporter substrate-binding protein [Candidatus Limnocylindria bacterium]|nr:ABC transporter substrate-binding protein [Candidatus Limnocylindria bacterium]
MNIVSRLVASLAIAAMVVAACTAAPETSKGPVKLVVLTHWGDQALLAVLQPIFDEYQKQNPNVKIEHQSVAFDELLKRITTGRLGGSAPDIYHFYNLWMPEFVASDLLQQPPGDVIADIKKGYSQSSVDGSSYRNQVWGYPTEVNTYQLIYNKKLLQEAGSTKPPATWDELRTVATKATKKGADGKVTQAGFLLLKGWDSGVVHPWSSLLWSNNGDYVAKDNSKVRFNEKAGIETTQFEVDLIKSGAADLGFTMDDFAAGKVAMTIMANWWGAALKKALPDNVGVAPIPTNGGAQSSTLQYNWLWGVDKGSKQGQEAWKFLTWLNGAPQAGGTSPMGKYLTTALNAIPARMSDQQANASLLGDAFVKPFVDSLRTSRSEPIIPGAQEIKTVLQKQIEAAWFGQKSPKDALDTAATEANRILSEKR